MYTMDRDRIKRLCPCAYFVCENNDMALKELDRLLEHLDLLQELNNHYRLMARERLQL